MAKKNDTGVFQLDNGNWAYRIYMNKDANGNTWAGTKSTSGGRRRTACQIGQRSCTALKKMTAATSSSQG